jgi:uncharacterized protein (TIGR00106 family)
MLAEFSSFPVGSGASLSKYVARSLRIIEESGLSYRINPMGTVLEGEWDDIFKVIKQCHHAILEDTERVVTSIKIDDRKGVTDALSRKIKSVEKKVGKELNK